MRDPHRSGESRNVPRKFRKKPKFLDTANDSDVSSFSGTGWKDSGVSYDMLIVVEKEKKKVDFRATNAIGIKIRYPMLSLQHQYQESANYRDINLACCHSATLLLDKR
jgi:hypothetical protein